MNSDKSCDFYVRALDKEIYYFRNTSKLPRSWFIARQWQEYAHEIVYRRSQYVYPCGPSGEHADPGFRPHELEAFVLQFNHLRIACNSFSSPWIGNSQSLSSKQPSLLRLLVERLALNQMLTFISSRIWNRAANVTSPSLVPTWTTWARSNFSAPSAKRNNVTTSTKDAIQISFGITESLSGKTRKPG